MKTHFLIRDIEKDDNHLEILLIEFENITNKSYMFHNCNLLEEFPLSTKENNEIELINKENIKELSSDDEKKYNKIYYMENNEINKESDQNKK